MLPKGNDTSGKGKRTVREPLSIPGTKSWVKMVRK